jgi:hypothetical protein
MGLDQGRVATPLLVVRTVRQDFSATVRVCPAPGLFPSLLAALVLVTGTSVGRAEVSVTLAWDANPETNVVSYRLYYGTASQSLTNVVDSGLQLTASVNGLREGTTYYFAVTARNSDGLESLPSEEISYQAPGLTLLMSPPAVPGDPMRLRFEAVPGQPYELLASDDLTNWATVYYTTPSASGWVEFADTESPWLPKRFYRLIRH